MLTRVGPGNAGYNFQPEFMDWDCVVTLAASGTLNTGQSVCRDVTAFPSSTGADAVVLPTNANAGTVYGVYQGPPITNPSSTATLSVPITVRQRGYGVVYAAAVTAGTAVTVGGLLQMVNTNNSTLQATTPTAGNYVGTALATGAVTTKGASIITVPGSGQTNLLINAYIVCT